MPQRDCVKDGLVAGAAAGLLGGMPSTLVLTLEDMDRSVQAIAHVIPGNRRFRSAWSRRALGAATHLAISEAFAMLYACVIRSRLPKPSLATAAGYGAVLWLVNYRLAGPKAMKAEDRSLALPDHLCWAAVVELTLGMLATRSGSAD